MSDDDHQPPAEPSPPRRGLRSYHLPFIIAAVCGLALVVMFGILRIEAIFPRENRIGLFGVCFGIVGAILVYDIPVCLLVLWQWYRTGEPPELNFEPLIPCAERRALYRAWKTRPQLDEDAFYDVFYADSGIAKETVNGVRREMQAILGRSLAGVHPADDMGLADPELDFADVFYRFEKNLHVVIPWQTNKIDFDFTFDSLIRLVADCKANKYPVPPASERQGFRFRVRYLPFIVAAICLIILTVTSNLGPGSVGIWLIGPTVAMLTIALPACLWILCRG